MSDNEERVIIPEVVGREELPGPDPDEGSPRVTGATRRHRRTHGPAKKDGLKAKFGSLSKGFKTSAGAIGP